MDNLKINNNDSALLQLSIDILKYKHKKLSSKNIQKQYQKLKSILSGKSKSHKKSEDISILAKPLVLPKRKELNFLSISEEAKKELNQKNNKQTLPSTPETPSDSQEFVSKVKKGLDALEKLLYGDQYDNIKNLNSFTGMPSEDRIMNTPVINTGTISSDSISNTIVNNREKNEKSLYGEDKYDSMKLDINADIVTQKEFQEQREKELQKIIQEHFPNSKHANKVLKDKMKKQNKHFEDFVDSEDNINSKYSIKDNL